MRDRDARAVRGDAPAGTRFDLFGTLVEVDRPPNPGAAVAAELEARGVTVPPDWEEAYLTSQVDTRPGREVSLPEHVRAILEARDALPTESEVIDGGVASSEAEVIREAVLAAFDSPVRTRDGAIAAVRAAADRGPVGVLSNCSVPGLVDQTLDRSALDPDRFDAVAASVACGWRKPDARAFETIADRLGVPVAGLLHVGDDPETDGGAIDAGANALLLEDVTLEAFPEFITESEGNWG